MSESAVVSAAGALPAWTARQLTSLLAQRGHAWLLAGPSGLGQYDLALAMVRAWLCNDPSGQGACGACGSCHAIDVRTHADLCVLMPETVMLELGWPLSEKAQTDIDDKKRKASKEIRIEAMRDAVEFSQRTSARGRGKAVLVFPAERMNNVTANALLKTLEEPPGDVKFVLASEAAHQLLPTIRSRCLVHSMAWPGQDEALAWLQTQGVPAAQAQTLLKAAGGRPQDALLFAQSGRDPKSWAALPRAMQRGDVSAIKDWTPMQSIDALHKLCHDLLAVKSGAQPRFFDAADLPNSPGAGAATSADGHLAGLTQWARALTAATRTMEHPFNPGLMLEALVNQAQQAMTRASTSTSTSASTSASYGGWKSGLNSGH
jgi:DNA polymerase III subunit delta'